ncbi:MAG: pyruvate kinase [Anaerolineae bacterium]|nr:pyruvate kinase [Anaerolineae bacterium]
MRKTKIICTIGPASRAPEILRQMIAAGMDVARLNLSHDNLGVHTENVSGIRAASEEMDRPVAILIDLQGPKLRVGQMQAGGVELIDGQSVTLTTRGIVGESPDALPVQFADLPQVVQPGDRILIDDGMIELQVLSTAAAEVSCLVVDGGILQTNKGMNLPRTPPGISSITPKDRTDLEWAIQQQVDWVALSFVRTADDVRRLKTLIRDLTPPDQPIIPVMAKIEKPQALENIDAIVAEADAMMVARGDLGVEIPAEEVPMAQKRIIRACNAAGMPVVTATQMLDSMIRNPRPTRAEVSDVANAILDGTDAIMLSGETSIGSFPVRVIGTMDRIAREVEGHRIGLDFISLQDAPTIANAVTRAAREIAHDVNATAIITPTTSGYTARLMSAYRPQSPIIATTADAIVQRQLMLYWGVTPLFAPRASFTDEMIAQAIRVVRDKSLVQIGDTVVITAGASGSAPGTTNLVQVVVVG